MGYEAFETATRRSNAWRGSPIGVLTRYRPQVAVSALVVMVLIGGADGDVSQGRGPEPPTQRVCKELRSLRASLAALK
jgi:hypothetical protein